MSGRYWDRDGGIEREVLGGDGKGMEGQIKNKICKNIASLELRGKEKSERLNWHKWGCCLHIARGDNFWVKKKKKIEVKKKCWKKFEIKNIRRPRARLGGEGWGIIIIIFFII